MLLRLRNEFGAKEAHGKRDRLSLAGEEGLAVLIALIALSVFSLLGLYMSLSATTEVRISDNYETHIQARTAAQSGMNHARELLKGLRFDYHLKGPDDTNNTSAAYLAQARTSGFRNPIDWATARSLDIFNPTSDVSSLPDDGILNNGKFASADGTALVPLTGIVQTAPNPYGSGTVTTSRYFLKVTDNNGEASELAGDPTDNPFLDGDGIILIRSVGVSQTIRETAGPVVRRNSVAIFEARYKQRTTFELDAPLLVQGSAVLPSGPNMFDGNAFDIEGGANNVGIATIDVNTSDGALPASQISSQLSAPQNNNVQGMGLTPSIQDITANVSADADKALLLDPNYLLNFVTNVLPPHADSVFSGNQSWAGGSAPDIGSYNVSLPPNHPSQNPKVTIVDGDLSISGSISGGGLMVIKGRFSGNGSFNFNGLILCIGAGDVNFGGVNVEINGGIYIVKVTETGGVVSFGTPKMTIAGNSDIVINSAALEMAVRLIPPSQLSWREITSTMDP